MMFFYKWRARMSTLTASVTDVSRHFSDYLNRVAYSGDRFILVRGGKPLAELKACSTAKKMSDLPEVLRSLPSLSDDELNSFENDLKSLRKSVPMEEGSPWDV
jgi:antitoxin (DNA-binding transcriptional repressor) of toxin-antitoxin stability system